MRDVRAMAAAVMLSLLATGAEACPYCDSAIGRQVRAEVFDQDFGVNAVLTLLPLLLLLGFVAGIHFGPAWPPRRSPQTTVEQTHKDDHE